MKRNPLPGRAAARRARSIGVAEEAMERRDRIGGHGDSRGAERVNGRGAHDQVVDAILKGFEAVGAVVGVAVKRHGSGDLVCRKSRTNAVGKLPKPVAIDAPL
jgi:hypothetical protein